MSAIDSLPPLRDVIARHEIAAKKSLGQNFLLDLNLTMKIARSAGELTNCSVLEIGPGPGGLTRALLAAGAKRVVAIERDPRCLGALQEIQEHYPGRLEIVEGDALAIDHRALFDGPVRIAANLPYNIATPLLTNWLAKSGNPSWFSSLTLMFQKEVAARICAKRGDKAWGRLAILSQWRCACELSFEVANTAFVPPPKVTSAIVNLRPHENPIACDVKKLEQVTKSAFGQRRKMLRSSLKPLGGTELLEKAGINADKRAEELEIEEFVKLAQLI